MPNAAYYQRALALAPHPEGGHYAETYRSELNVSIPEFDGPRSISTSIYFMLESGETSSLHRIKSDEIWYFQDGDALEVIEIDESGNEIITLLSRDIDNGAKLQHVVKAGRWFGARLPEGSAFCLVGCQVSPGFDFRDFELK